MAKDYSKMTWAEAGQMLEAIRVYEGLEQRGEIRPDQKAALDQLRADGVPETLQGIRSETGARYGGFVAGVSMNLDDEIRGAYNAATDSFKSGDKIGAKAAYAKYRDLQRQQQAQRKGAYPEEFASGETYGQVASMAIPAGGYIKAADKLGVGGKILTGMATGGAAAAAPQFAAGEGGFGERVGNVDPLSVAVGTAIGGAAPVAGRIAGGLARGPQNLRQGGVAGTSGGATRRVAKKLPTSKVEQDELKAYLASIGEEGMLADVSGRPRALAQGLAVIPGEGAEVMTGALSARASGKGQRIQDVMNRQIGEPEAAFQARMALASERTNVLGPEYEVALASGGSFDVDGLRIAIKAQSDDAASNVRASLDTVLSDLKSNNNEVSAIRLHNARSALSDAIESAKFAGQRNKATQLGSVLNMMDDSLNKIDGYKAARTGYANNKAMERAIDAGRKVFPGGVTTAMSPQEVKNMLNNMSIAERDAFKKGAREYVAALMGTSKNEAAAAWGAFAKEWNSEKLAMIIGKSDADVVTQRLFAEQEFSKTKGLVEEGSQTGFRKEASDDLGDLRDSTTMTRPTPGKRLKTAVYDDPVNRIIDEIKFGRGDAKRDIATLMTLQGAERDAAVNLMLKKAVELKDPTKLQRVADILTQMGVMSISPMATQE